MLNACSEAVKTCNKRCYVNLLGMSATDQASGATPMYLANLRSKMHELSAATKAQYARRLYRGFASVEADDKSGERSSSEPKRARRLSETPHELATYLPFFLANKNIQRFYPGDTELPCSQIGLP